MVGRGKRSKLGCERAVWQAEKPESFDCACRTPPLHARVIQTTINAPRISDAVKKEPARQMQPLTALAAGITRLRSRPGSAIDRVFDSEWLFLVPAAIAARCDSTPLTIFRQGRRLEHRPEGSIWGLSVSTIKPPIWLPTYPVSCSPISTTEDGSPLRSVIASSHFPPRDDGDWLPGAGSQ